MGGLQECWQSLTSHPAGAGGAVWMWADQGLKTPTKKDRSRYGSLAKDDDYLRLNPEGWDGITDSYRKPTRDYWEVKAVYCPVTPTYEQGKMKLHNGYDFLNLNTVGIRWQTFNEAGKPIAEDTVRLNAQPHQSAFLDIDTKKAAYVWLMFTDPQGHEIGKKSVELQPLSIANSTCTLGTDDLTGLPKGFRPTVWHKLNDGDQIIKNRNFASNPEKFTTRVVSRQGNTWQMHYEINDSNSIDATYTVSNGPQGLTIDYAITPRLQSTYVPVVGLAYEMNDPSSLKHWFGLGPDEAYPNKQAATLLGLWDATTLAGTRRMQWVEADGMRLWCDGYLDRDSQDDKTIRLLSHVLGRSEKGRLNYPEYQLPQGSTYRGRVVVQQIKQ